MPESPVGAGGPWRRRWPWLAGLLLCGVGVAALLPGRRAGSPGGRAFGGFPGAPEGDLAGLEDKKSPAPDSQAQAQVQDSLTMIPRSKAPEGAASASASAPAAKGDPSFIDALKAIADKKEAPAKPTTFPGRIQAMASGLFGSGGGGGSGPGSSGSSLAAPASDSLVKVSKPGAGAAPMVPRERDFRAAYGDGGGGGARRSGGAPGALQSMASPTPGGAASAGRSAGGLPQGPSASAAPGGGGGYSPTTPIATPPSAGAGKGLQPLDAKGKPADAKAADSSGGSSSSGSSAASSLGSSLGSSAGSALSGGGSSSGQSSSDGPAVRTGTSRYGLVGDSQNGTSWTDTLGTAGGPPHVVAGTGETAPSYNPDGLLRGNSAQRDRLMESREYQPEGVTQVVTKAQALKPLTQPEPKTGLFDGGVDPGMISAKLGQVGGKKPTDRATEMVLEARKADTAAFQQSKSYYDAVQAQAGKLSAVSGTAVQSSQSMLAQKKEVEQLETSLTKDLRAQMETQAQKWHSAAAQTPPNQTLMRQAAADAQKAMDAYAGKANDVVTKGDRLAADLDRKAKDAQQLQADMGKALDKAKTDYAASLSKLDQSISSLRSEIATAGASFSGEGADTQGRKLVANGVQIVRELNADRQTLLKAQADYSQASAGLNSGSKAVVGVYRGGGR